MACSARRGVIVPTLVDARGFTYPAFDLLMLFAMGLYRRDAILETGRSLTRVPLVVGMGSRRRPSWFPCSSRSFCRRPGCRADAIR